MNRSDWIRIAFDLFCIAVALLFFYFLFSVSPPQSIPDAPPTRAPTLTPTLTLTPTVHATITQFPSSTPTATLTQTLQPTGTPMASLTITPTPNTKPIPTTGTQVSNAIIVISFVTALALLSIAYDAIKQTDR